MKEYAIDIYDDNSFVRQLDVYNSCEEARDCIENDEYCSDDEYYVITCVEYDNEGEEIGSYPVS